MAIGTGMAIALGISALAGQTASNIYGTRSANRTNRQSLAAGERSDERAAAQAREDAQLAQQRADADRQVERDRLAAEKATEDARLAETKAERESRERRDMQRWQDYLRINEPFWQRGAGIANNLFDIAGFGQEGAPAFAMPEGGPPPMAGGGAPAYPGDPSAPIPGGPRGPMNGGPIPDGMQTMSARGGRPAPAAIVPVPQQQSMNLADLMMMAKSIGKGGNGQRMPPPESLTALAGMGLR